MSENEQNELTEQSEILEAKAAASDETSVAAAAGENTAEETTEAETTEAAETGETVGEVEAVETVEEVEAVEAVEAAEEAPAREFALADEAAKAVASEAPIKKETAAGEKAEEKATATAEAEAAPKTPEKPVDPVFAALAEPRLPNLQRENRARLQMQSPTRLYFYWSIKNNPFQTLQKVFGGRTGNYQLVAKLINRDNDREEMYAVEPEGNWWFNVEANANYRAEIGFYAPNRPYIRVIYSNEIETPRRSPSPRAASEAEWAISARDFASVLDNTGFTRDAFEVALAGDDRAASEAATNSAFQQLVGAEASYYEFDAEELRFAILALASGARLESLRGQISEALYIFLAEHAARLSVENALAALNEHFDVFDEEIFEEEETGAAVYGASLVHFPKAIKKRGTAKTVAPKSAPGFAPKLLPKLAPLSSFSWKN